MYRAGAVQNPWRASLPASRSRLVPAALLLSMLLLCGRAFFLQAVNHSVLQARGDAYYRRIIEVPAYRGRIVDRNGEPLAVSTPVRSVWAVPSEVEATSAEFAQLARLLELSTHELRAKLAETEREFVSLNRSVPPEIAARITALQVPGIFQDTAYRRFYPAGDVMAHLVGFTDLADHGQEGMELAFQKELAGTPGRRGVIRDRKGAVVEDAGLMREAQQGRDVTLSIDARIQSLAFRALRDAVIAQHARAGSIIVLDTQSGEVLALANLPTFNPNNRGQRDPAQLRNRVLTDSFEPGSTLKPFTISVALEEGKVTPETLIQTAGTFAVGTATIHDAHQEGVLNVAQVIQKSSNIGAAKIALGLTAESMWQMFQSVGFGTAPHLGFPGESGGRLRNYKTWRPIEQATMAYGHGIAVSLAQLAHAYLMFARDGEVISLSLTRSVAEPEAHRVISAKTAKQVRTMLEMAVQPGGTAPAAQIVGYRVGGKTGTAHKPENGTYSESKYIASFVGMAPASHPRFVIAVMIDEPHSGEYYGGQVAAPVFATVMSGALRMFNIAPDAPMTPIALPTSDGVVEEGT